MNGLGLTGRDYSQNTKPDLRSWALLEDFTQLFFLTEVSHGSVLSSLFSISFIIDLLADQGHFNILI